MATIEFTVSLNDHHQHLLHIELVLHKPPTCECVLRLPTWTPGSYLIREHAKNIVSIVAFDENHQSIHVQKTDKCSWQLRYTNRPDHLRIVYQVYAHDQSVRTCFANDYRAFWDGSSIMLTVQGYENASHQLIITDIPESWQIATSMRPAHDIAQTLVYSATHNCFLAENYEDFVDHPVECAKLAYGSFTVRNCHHVIAISSRTLAPYDLHQLSTDLQAICQTQINFFDPETQVSPNQHYLFLLHLTQDGYGGLEHTSSTALAFTETAIPILGESTRSPTYSEFLSLCSHEYFHQWWVKRVKPCEFINPNRFEECYTDLLWVFEGWTSYYDNLFLLRSQCIDLKSYIKILNKDINRYLQTPGRLQQSLAESSWDAWIKLYRPHENSQNDSISYYLKGSMVALCLDLWIRQQTNHAHSLDDVVRHIWKKYLSNQFLGVSSTDIIDAIEATAQQPFEFLYQEWVHSTKELPLLTGLNDLGLDTQFLPKSSYPQLDWGWKLTNYNGPQSYRITQIIPDQAAQNALLSVNDILVAISQRIATPTNFALIERTHDIGKPIHITFFRDGHLKETTIYPQAQPLPIEFNYPPEMDEIGVFPFATQQKLHKNQ